MLCHREVQTATLLTTMHDALSGRYYAQQRAADAISSNMVNDELKRHSRINRQLAEEQRVMEELYKVRQYG